MKESTCAAVTLILRRPDLMIMKIRRVLANLRERGERERVEGARKERKRGEVGGITRVRWFREEEEEEGKVGEREGREREKQIEGREIRVRWVRIRNRDGEMVGGAEEEEEVAYNEQSTKHNLVRH